jgi:hypothetical protein
MNTENSSEPPRRRRWKRHNARAVAAGLAAGLTQREAGALGNMSDRQVRRLLDDPQFNALVDELRSHHLRDVRDALAAKFAKASITLGHLLDAPTPAAVRLGAVRLTLQELRKYSEVIDRTDGTEHHLATDSDRALLNQLLEDFNHTNLEEDTDLEEGAD